MRLGHAIIQLPDLKNYVLTNSAISKSFVCLKPRWRISILGLNNAGYFVKRYDELVILFLHSPLRNKTKKWLFMDVAMSGSKLGIPRVICYE